MRDDLEPVRALLPGTRIELVERLRGGGRSRVERVRLRGDGSDRTVVVKRFGAPGEGWVREVAALGILPPGIAPDLLAADAATGTLVLGDLGNGPTLADTLLAHDPDAAARALCGWAEALAGLHSAARPLHDRFAEALAGHQGEQAVPLSRVHGELADTALALPERCATLGVPVPTGAVNELRGLATRLGGAGAPSRSPASLSPVDTCPDDAVLRDGRYRLLDFEGAQWRHVAWDVAYLRVPWPTCWCSWRIPDGIADRAIETYRHAAAAALPEVTEDAFVADLEAAAVGWALTTVTWFLEGALQTEDAAYADREAPSRRATVLDRLARAGHSGELPALAELARSLAAELRSRWGDVMLPLAPAFRAW